MNLAVAEKGIHITLKYTCEYNVPGLMVYNLVQIILLRAEDSKREERERETEGERDARKKGDGFGLGSSRGTHDSAGIFVVFVSLAR